MSVAQENLLPIEPPCLPRRPHVLLLPYQVQGHINPFLTLANLLASSGILVTVVFSASTFSLLQQNSSLEAGQSRIRVEAILDETPAQDVDDPGFVHSMQKLQGGLQQLIQKLGKEDHPVSCLMSDILMPWTHEVASKFGIPRFEFSIFPASTYYLAYRTQMIVDRGYFPFKPGTEEEIIDFIPGFAPLRVADIPMDFRLHDVSHLQVILRILSHVKEASGLLINTVDDLESCALEALRSEQISVYPVGPLIRPVVDKHNSRNDNPLMFNVLPEDMKCMKWLDGQADSSVVYVSFGSLACLSKEEIQELAIWLEACQHHFLWVIRPDVVSETISDILPVGFHSRTKDRGLVVSWAPQFAVLSHRSVSVFVCHTGWSSVLESLWAGVPMVGCPKLSDQNTILKLITDWKVGVPIEGWEKMGITRGSVEAAVRAMGHGEEGKAARTRIMELRKTLRNAVAQGGSSEKSIHKLVQDLKDMVSHGPISSSSSTGVGGKEDEAPK